MQSNTSKQQHQQPIAPEIAITRTIISPIVRNKYNIIRFMPPHYGKITTRRCPCFFTAVAYSYLCVTMSIKNWLLSITGSINRIIINIILNYEWKTTFGRLELYAILLILILFWFFLIFLILFGIFLNFWRRSNGNKMMKGGWEKWWGWNGVTRKKNFGKLKRFIIRKHRKSCIRERGMQAPVIVSHH